MEIKTQSCKSKGRKLQQHVASRIREVFDLPEDDVVSTSMGKGGEDVMMSDRARKELPISIECKNTKIFPSLSALDQAKGNSKGFKGCVVWKPPKKGYSKSIIYFDLDDFLTLWKEKA
jgi:hypothetical protein